MLNWTSWNSTSKSAELEMCYGKTQNQNKRKNIVNSNRISEILDEKCKKTRKF